MKKILLYLCIYSLPFVNLYAENNTTTLDVYHENLCKLLLTTSNSIDDYFVDSNESTSSRTKAEFETSLATESYGSLEKDIRFRLRLNLPKIQKNLRLILEDENSDDTLYDKTVLSEEKLKDKDYYLRLEYFRLLKKKLNLSASGGVKIKQSHLIPYFNIYSSYFLYKKEKSKSKVFNRFRYFINGEIENSLEFNSFYSIDNRLSLIWDNQYKVNSEDKFEVFYTNISSLYELNERQYFVFGFAMKSYLRNFKNMQVDYYHLHLLTHHLFYKNWAYYEIAPSILKRAENQFKTSYRFLISLGILFDND